MFYFYYKVFNLKQINVLFFFIELSPATMAISCLLFLEEGTVGAVGTVG